MQKFNIYFDMLLQKIENKQECWLSILVPVFNVESYLEECIDSIASQIDAGVEIIMLDDCSTDSSALVMQRLFDKYKSVITLSRHEKNRGLSAARNSMISLARGRYIWFVDSDDVLNRGAIQSLRHTIDSCAPDLVICDFKMWRENQTWKHVLRGENHKKSFDGVSNFLIESRSEIVRGMFANGNFHAWSKISKKSLWGGAMQFHEGMYFEDMEAIPRLLLKCNSCVYVDEVWVHYRQRQGSILSTMNFRKIHDLSNSLNSFKSDLMSLGTSEVVEISKSAGFFINHQVARNFISMMKFSKFESMKKSVDYNGAYEIALSNFYSACVVGENDFLLGYVKRFWWLRLCRLLVNLVIAKKNIQTKA